MEAGRFDLLRYLSLLPLFSDFAPPELQRVADGSRLRRLARNDMVCRVGDPCEEFHVVVTGQVKLFAISPMGQEKVVELIGPAHSFGEALVFLNKPYILNAQTLTDTLLIDISKQVVLDELERNPRFSLRMLAGVSRRLHNIVHDVQAYALHSGMQRVIGYLLRSHHNGDGEPCAQCFDVNLPTSKATLASRLSLTPEYFSRVLHELEAAGLITIDKRHITVVDAVQLSRHGLL